MIKLSSLQSQDERNKKKTIKRFAWKDFYRKEKAARKTKKQNLFCFQLKGRATTRPHGQGFCTQPSLRAESGVRTPLTGLQDEQSPSEQTLFAEMLLRGQEKRTRNNLI